MNTAVRFDTTPLPDFLRAMRNQRWNITGAIAELVDNSFGPVRGNANNCYIIYNPRSRRLTVLDDGQGMANIGRLFQLGNTIGRGPGDIGLYGSGGTMALLWLAEAVEVATLRDGEVSSDEVDWEQCIHEGHFPRIDESWRPATPSSCPKALLELGHGTMISLQLDKARGRLAANNLKRDLGKMYAPGIRAGKRIVVTVVGSDAPEILADPIRFASGSERVVDFNLLISLPDADLPVVGQVGIVDGITVNDAGLHVGYGSRVITKTKDCFQSPDGARKYSGSSVVGWLDLGDGWQPYLSTTKDGFNDRNLWNALMGHVFGRIEDLLKECEEDKLTLELEDIALSLRHLLDGQARVAVAKPDQDKGDEEPDDEHGDEQADRPSRELPPGDRPDSAGKPAKPQISIIPEPDEQMPYGALCYAEVVRETVKVMVNKDHEVIQLAMQAKPINKALLHQVVVHEVANVLADNPELIELAFRRRDARALAEIETPDMRARRCLRLLTDNIRRAS